MSEKPDAPVVCPKCFTVSRFERQRRKQSDGRYVWWHTCENCGYLTTSPDKADEC